MSCRTIPATVTTIDTPHTQTTRPPTFQDPLQLPDSPVPEVNLVAAVLGPHPRGDVLVVGRERHAAPVGALDGVEELRGAGGGGGRGGGGLEGGGGGAQQEGAGLVDLRGEAVLGLVLALALVLVLSDTQTAC